MEKVAFVDNWLREQTAKREAPAAANRTARDEQSLELAREANAIAKEANDRSAASNRLALLAIVVAALALIAQVVQIVIG